HTTGPNTSSRQAGRPAITGSGPASTVGGYQKPGPAGAEPVNATGASGPTYPATFDRCAAEISGPISTSGEVGSPTATPLTAASNSAMNRSYTGRCTRIRDRAQQSCPALSKTAYGAVAAARSRSASANTMFALLPPSSRVTRFTCAAQAAITDCPTETD